jgi:hypothetical protein
MGVHDLLHQRYTFSEEPDVRFNPRALVVFLAVCLMFALAASWNSSWVHAAEAATTVVIFSNLVGLLRERRRTD